MKKWLFQLLVLSSFSVMSAEEEVLFTYLGTEEGYEAYYACSYAQEQAELYLKGLGAKDIKLECSGGLRGPYDWHDPLKLRASFNMTPVEGEVIFKSEHLFTACAMNTRLIKKIIEVVPGITLLEKRDKCGHPRNPYYFKLKVVRN